MVACDSGSDLAALAGGNAHAQSASGADELELDEVQLRTPESPRLRRVSRESSPRGSGPPSISLSKPVVIHHAVPRYEEDDENEGGGIGGGNGIGDGSAATGSAAAPTPSALEPPAEAPLPECAHAFVGSWRHVRSEGYDAFLHECIGLSWPVRKVAERIHPTPRFRIADGQLSCEIICMGAKPCFETLVEGPSTFFEPNQSVTYDVHGRWEGECFASTRRSEEVNGGRPILQRRWIDDTTGELHIVQDWGGAKSFLARYIRRQPDARPPAA